MGLTRNVIANAGSFATFTVTTTGTAPLSYQWHKDGVNVPGATSASLTLSNVQTNEVGNYAVVITNAYGSVTSSVAVLTVNAPALPGDFNGDGLVNFDDFFLFAAAFGKPGTGANAKFDLDGEGNIGFGDFFIFAANFGKTAK